MPSGLTEIISNSKNAWLLQSRIFLTQEEVKRQAAAKSDGHSANSYTFSHLVVGADAHIGPLGSREFSKVPIKNQCILRADRSIRPKMRGIFRTLP